MKKRIFGFTVKDMVEISMLVGIAVILDTVLKIPFAATGGSINLAMAPLFIIALRHGPFKAFIASGVVFGLITCLIDGYGFPCYPLEYFLSFGVVGILGSFAKFINTHFENKKGIVTSYVFVVSSIIICAAIRLFASTIDSMILWDYEFIPALIYNVSYVLISAGFVCVIILILLPIIIKLNDNFTTSYLGNKDENIDIDE